MPAKPITIDEVVKSMDDRNTQDRIAKLEEKVIDLETVVRKIIPLVRTYKGFVSPLFEDLI